MTLPRRSNPPAIVLEPMLRRIRKVLEYNWKDEQKHWEEHGKPKSGHIFCDLKKLDEQLHLGLWQENHPNE